MTGSDRPAQIAVVTGGGRGLGREIARGLGDRGFAVLVTDLDGEAAATVAEAIPGAWSMPHDVGDSAAHREVASAVAARGRLTVWVNNAAVLRLGPVWEQGDDDLAESMRTNALGVMYGARAAIEQMRAVEAEDGGSACDIVNIASFAAYGPLPNLAGYVASKHAVLGFTTSLQADLDAARLPIRAHVVCVDGMDTPMVRAHAGDPAAAMLTAGGQLLDPGTVARRVLGILGTRRLVSSIPTGRAAATRIVGLVPRLSNRLTAAIARRARTRAADR